MPAIKPTRRTSVTRSCARSEREQRVQPGVERCDALERSFGSEQVERREPGGARDRISGVRMSVEELQVRIGRAEERVVDASGRQHRRERERAAGDPLPS